MKCVLILNPASGKGNIIKKKEMIVSMLQEKFSLVEVYETKSKMDAIDSAKRYCDLVDCIVFSGGDGTFNDIACGVASKEKRPVLGYIPSGTVNDIARNLRIPKNVKKAVRIILEGNTVKHDVGMINDQYFMYVVAIGTFTGVSYRTKHDAKRIFGRLAYAFDGLKDLLSPSMFNIQIEHNGTVVEQETPLALVLNSISVGGIPFNKNGHLNDGQFDVLLVKKDLSKGLFNIVSMFVMGLLKIRRKKTVTHIKVDTCQIRVDSEPTWSVDGEAGPVGNVVIRNLHNHLTIYIPKRRNQKPKSRSFIRHTHG